MYRGLLLKVLCYQASARAELSSSERIVLYVVELVAPLTCIIAAKAWKMVWHQLQAVIINYVHSSV